jgi:mono/diheme cytochrome c family protein
MSDERTGRELTPRPEEPESAVTPREGDLPAPSTQAGDRFYAGDQAHAVGLTEERAAQVVRQSSNGRMIAFLATLLIVLFIPLYWLYDIGLSAVGFPGRLENEANEQYVVDVSRGYALFLANCARCHGSNGEGAIGPALNDQAKLFQAVTDQGTSGKGHLNPDYLRTVLRDGGRVICGDPNSVMPAWLEPKGPLNYREVEDIIKFITASKDVTFVYQPHHVELPATLPPPVNVQGWRDPNYSPPPDATPVPACWRAPSSTAAPATAAPITSPGTPESPRVIEIEASANVQWVDPATGAQLTQIAVVDGETVEFHVINNTPTTHNLHIGSATELEAAPQENDLPGVDTFTNGTQTFTWTVEDLPDQPQFACTVLGHYGSMNGNIVVQTAGGGSGSPAPSTSAAPAASASAAPAASASAAPSP